MMQLSTCARINNALTACISGGFGAPSYAFAAYPWRDDGLTHLHFSHLDGCVTPWAASNCLFGGGGSQREKVHVGHDRGKIKVQGVLQ